MEMKIIEGNLITLAKAGRFDVIVHGCNCFCTMGAGIAKSIKLEFPEAYQVDLQTIKGDKSKLGTITYADVKVPDKHVMQIKITKSFKKGYEVDRVGPAFNSLTVVNGYTQYNYYGKTLLVEYNAVRSVFKEVKSLFSDGRIGYPKIGAGLAGGSWSIIEKIIDEELQDEDHTLVIFKP